MTTVTFYFAIPIPSNSGTSSTGRSADCNNSYTPGSNDGLTAMCPGGSYAFYSDGGGVSCSNYYQINSGDGVNYCDNDDHDPNGDSVCCGHQNKTCSQGSATNASCANWSRPWGPSKVYRGYQAHTGCTLNFNCYKPNESNYLTTPAPTTGPSWVGFRPTASGGGTSTPTHGIFSVVYSISSLSTATNVSNAIDKFISSSVLTALNTADSGGILATTNITSINTLLAAVCPSSSSNLQNFPCNKYCKFETGSIATGITNAISNCTGAWTSYCNSPSTFTTTQCTDYYSDCMSRGNQSYISSILQPNCNNPSFWTTPNPSVAGSIYQLSPSMPPICNCFLPATIYNKYYDKLTALAPAVAAAPMTPQCTFQACSTQVASTGYLYPAFNAQNCPNVAITSCINTLNLNNSSVQNITMSNDCATKLQIPPPPAPPGAPVAPPTSVTVPAGANPANQFSIPPAVPSTLKQTSSPSSSTTTTSTAISNPTNLFFLAIVICALWYFTTRKPAMPSYYPRRPY